MYAMTNLFRSVLPKFIGPNVNSNSYLVFVRKQETNKGNKKLRQSADYLDRHK